MTLSPSYFDDMYAANRDPWSLASRWYEQRKYAVTLACLTRPRYRRAFEPGCSIGVLTERPFETSSSIPVPPDGAPRGTCPRVCLAW